MTYYGTFEALPCVFNDTKAFVLYDPAEGWRQDNLAEVRQIASLMTEQQFHATYPWLPEVPLS